jgi:hypothetical protein
MFIHLTATNGDEYRLMWWQIRALVTPKNTTQTTVHARIDERSVVFDVPMDGKDVETLVESNKGEMLTP